MKEGIVIFWVLFALYLLLSCGGLLLIKLGGSTTSFSFVDGRLVADVNLRFVLGLLCYIMSFLLFTYVIQKRDLSYIGPMGAGIINIITVLAGIFVLHEKLTMLQITGAGIVIAGIVLMNIRR